MFSLVDLLCILLVGFVDFFVFVPFLLALLLKKIPFLHRKPVSDIPGNPHAFDPAVISLFRTLPEPSNMNIVFTNLPLGEPLLIRGYAAPSRCASLSLYGQNSSDNPQSTSIDFHSETRYFEIVLASSSECYQGSKKALCGNHWNRGFCAMRNYLVPPGTRIITPEIVTANNNKVIRPSVKLYAGPSHLELRGTPSYRSLARLCILNVFLGAILLRIYPSYLQSLIILAGGLFLFIVLYQMCFILGKLGLRRHVGSICGGKENSLVFASLEQGSSASQPSALHRYWIMRYNTSTKDVQISGLIKKSEQQYWSIVAYDDYGLPLSQYFFDGNARNFSQDKEEYFQFVIQLSSKAPNKTPIDYDILDVSESKQGYILFRIVHPRDVHQVFSTPKVTIIQDSENGGDDFSKEN